VAFFIILSDKVV